MGMLDMLYEEAARNREKIIQTTGRDETIDIGDSWNNHQIPDSPPFTGISAGDGSINKIRYIPFILYAVGAESLIYTDQGLEKVESGLVDTIPKHKYAEDRLRNYMSILEVKTAIRMIRTHNVGYYLLDGSLLGDLIRPSPFQIKSNLKEDIREIIHTKYLPMLKTELDREKFENKKLTIISNQFLPMMAEEDFKNITEAMVYLEKLENLIVITNLLIEGQDKIIAISKTSTSTEYFNQEIPDMAVFDMHGHESGYSSPRYVEVMKKKREFPVSNDFLNSLTFTIFYTRLNDYKNILKFELPGRVEKNDIPALLRVVKSVSAGGYPILLKRAHDDVVIRKGDMDLLVISLGLVDRKERGML